MYKLLTTFWCAIFFISQTLVHAQSITPHWASQIHNSSADMVLSGSSLATDKEGNNYVLVTSGLGGYMNADGVQTSNSDVTMALASWDCDHNFRWMRTMGGSATHSGLQLKVDTVGGIYIAGRTLSNSSPGNVYWDADTTLNVPANSFVEYLVKYDTSGQFQWLRTPASYTGLPSTTAYLSITPSGQVYWFSLLEPGSYNGGTINISTRKYYALHYDASGTYISVTPFDMTPPTTGSTAPHSMFAFDHSTHRFYACLVYQPTYGPLTIGTTNIIASSTANPRTSVLAAFNSQGNSLWTRQGGTAKNTSIRYDIDFGDHGTLFISGTGDLGSIFCGDTSTNPLAQGTQNTTTHVMALDTNANLLWSNYLTYNSAGTPLNDLSVLNNTLVVTGGYAKGLLSWGNDTLINPFNNTKGYWARLNAATGSILQLDSIHSAVSYNYQTSKISIDKNGNIYLLGRSLSEVYFANDTLSPYANGNNGKAYNSLLKYKNVPCNCDLLQPSFLITGNAGASYQFSYTGQTPYTALSWDFGDGSQIVSGTNPSHTYSSPGHFTVCVTATNSCGSNTACQYLTIDASTAIFDETTLRTVSLYPNPVKDILSISNLEPGTTVEIIDVSGKNLKKVKANNHELSIHLTELSAGIHLIRFTDNSGRKKTKIFVKN